MSSVQVAVVDYGMYGTLQRAARAGAFRGAQVCLVADGAAIASAGASPCCSGVGAFEDGMRGLRERGLIQPIWRTTRSRANRCSIGLGMQMLATISEEFGEHAGLDLVPGVSFLSPGVATNGSRLKIPHIGWSPLQPGPAAAVQSSVLEDTALGHVEFISCTRFMSCPCILRICSLCANTVSASDHRGT